MEISIIVPVYNTKQFLKRCIDSLLNQTQKVEIVLVDDGSDDGSEILCDEYDKNYDNIKVIHKKNGGVSAARNDGLKAADGKYIGFVDSDDWVEADMFETLFSVMKDTNSDLSACGVFHETEDKTISEENTGNIWITDRASCYKEILGSNELRGYLCNKLFKKDLIAEMIDETLSQCEDLLFVANYLKNIKFCAYIQKPMYHYRRRSGAGDFGYSRRSLTLMDAYEKILQIYEKEAPEYADIVRQNCLKIYLNFRSRSLILRDKSVEIKEKIKNGIKKHMKSVIVSNKVSLKEKFNIVLTYLFPKTILRLKKKMIAKQHSLGHWES